MNFRDDPGKVNMFSKVLIANRGAIAVRITRTLQAMGIGAIAVYADSDADSLHVRHADAAYSLGDGPAADTYLDIDKLITIAKQSGAEAIHPGYGFLSENAGFVRRCEAEGLIFIGPTAEQIETFGLKHKARALAEAAAVPLSPGSALLSDVDAALSAAEQIGYPVMLKTTAGGGGIGMQLCHSAEALVSAFDGVKRLGANNFSDDGVFVEKFIARARHIEVQVFGDGAGGAIAIGERDCSSQRRNQKVVEECPAPGLSDTVRQRLHATAEQLLASVNYRNAGTVEFIYDADSEAFYFLEVNTRLQVEHGVTEEVFGIDLVNWMVTLAAGEARPLSEQRAALSAQGHAVQVRVYAEDPFRDFQPSAGLLTEVVFPSAQALAMPSSAALENTMPDSAKAPLPGARAGLRIDHWIEAGLEVSPYFDPMLAKIIVHAASRDAAFDQLSACLNATRLYGEGTSNLDYLRALVNDNTLRQAEVTTRYLDDFAYTPARIDVLQGGTQTTIQDYPARTGLWDVGVPPSGPFDNHSFRLGNRLLGNSPEMAGLEITMQGPTLKFSSATQVVLTGATLNAELDGAPVAMWQVTTIAAGQTLQLGRIKAAGARAYLCVAGGIQCPQYLGSRATFTLGQFGGHNGRALRSGDVLPLTKVSPSKASPSAGARLPASLQPEIDNAWQLRVIVGPHSAPDFFTEADMKRFFEHEWEVHYNSSRTGVRLIGPKPEWARQNGGEAGLHPSNIHDNAYAFGTVDFTGDMPVILGPDGPSLGGFVCPATVIHADHWKLGQLRAGDKIRFVAVTIDHAHALQREQETLIDTLQAPAKSTQALPAFTHLPSPILATIDAGESKPRVVYRAAGDHFLLVEYGEQVLDIALRFRVHALMQWLQAESLPGLLELTPGIRSLQMHFDGLTLSHEALLDHLQRGEAFLDAQLDALSVPSRIVHIPLSWDDEACQQAITKYEQSVRQNAPWCPSNLEFIRRINGLDSIADVKGIVFAASYLVMGLGDVYLGAPVATPVNPQHRLVTTKYNPARTWTAENSVGIGGSYLCVYGMEGPGGYQFVGRTLQMWNRYRQTREFEQPWLLRFFDQIRFYEVSHEELAQIRQDFPQGRYPLKIEQSQFSLADYEAMLQTEAPDITKFTAQRQAAFDAELARWHADGQFNFTVDEVDSQASEVSWPEDSQVIDSPVSGSVWQSSVAVGQRVQAGETLMVLESMKMEIPVQAHSAGVVSHVLLTPGQHVAAGQALIVLRDAVDTDDIASPSQSSDAPQSPSQSTQSAALGDPAESEHEVR